MEVTKEVKLEEYQTLQEEHRRNRSYIFERPILILGAVSVALQYLFSSNIGQFIIAAIVLVLVYNLWFIGNRIRSDARIVTYIELVHEGEWKNKWFGWESSLVQFRIISNKDDVRKLISDLPKESSEDQDSSQLGLSFYSGIWYLHIFLVSLIVTIGTFTWVQAGDLLAGMQLIAIIIAAIIFFIYAFGFLHPSNIKSSTRRAKIIWNLVFKERKVEYKRQLSCLETGIV